MNNVIQYPHPREKAGISWDEQRLSGGDEAQTGSLKFTESPSIPLSSTYLLSIDY